MKNHDIKALYDAYLLPNYKRESICFAKGKGSRLWDLEGKEYLDFFPGWAVSGLGHCHPAVVNAIRHQTSKLLHVSNNFLISKQAQLAKKIVEHSFPGKLFFCNSGAESVEAAIKFSRRLGNETGRFEIVSTELSFHGRTWAAMNATGQARIHQGFGPEPDGFSYVPFNDIEALRAKITDKTAAFIVEPVQGEGGVRPASQEFLKLARELCDQQGALLIMDEVQTCMGRTGKMFAYQHYGIEPDLLCLAKSLGNGVPIGAMVANNRLPSETFSPGTHGSTYGGNPLVCAAALAVFKTIETEKLLERATAVGREFREKLEGLRSEFSLIREVRGLGLMLAIELEEDGTAIAQTCLERGLIINCTQGKVLRIMPAINVSRKDVGQAIKILKKVFATERCSV